MFNHILVPLDGSQLAECVLPHIQSLALACGARVTLLNVVDQFQTGNSYREFNPVDFAICKAEAHSYLHEVSDRLIQAGLQVVDSFVEGKAADCILQYAHHNEVDLIVLSSHGRSGLSPWNISNVTLKVLQRAQTSLMIVPACHPKQQDFEAYRYQRLFVALDGSSRAEWVLPCAVKLGAAHHGALLIAHVVPRPEMPSHLPLLPEEIELLDRIVEYKQRNASIYLDNLCSQLPTGEFEIQTCLEVSDNLIATLHRLVDQESADLVILSAHGYTGDFNRPYGSITWSFITSNTAPLLILQDIPPEIKIPERWELLVQEKPGH